MTIKPQAKYLQDYQPPEFFIPNTELFFNLDDNQTLVRSKLTMVRNGSHQHTLKLDTQVEKILSIKINSQPFSEFEILDEVLIINTTLNEFILEIESLVDPENNKALEGLYKSSGVFCTQCEAEGFRKITPYLDRPDVLSKFTVTIFADQSEYPNMLANGNLVDSGEVIEEDSVLSWVKWQDPFPKPSYLFALVAGDFDLLSDTFLTRSGREVALELYVDKGNLHLADHAMSSLKKSMTWDEQKYGLEYDLDVYMIVAVDFFNMGAMENKGLNVFNSKYVLADENTATDVDYHGVEAVIAHEYFHNWTGNRVTCRDWFQLSLKEGLTVFRDQQFSADMGSEVIERIKHANIIRTMQFAEDSGPMAHPIRPQKVIEMNNFYTVTVYDKGAEVIRMMHSILGETGFRKGMDLYFQRHDGQAVTCDDFVAAMADATGTDLSKFKHWYQQAGTPVVNVDVKKSENGIGLTLSQTIPTRPEDEKVKTLVIPVKYELLSSQGESVGRGTLLFDQIEQTFQFNCNADVTIVLFENFSAPVKVERQVSDLELAHIVKFASDPFCRWDAMQSLWLSQINNPETDESIFLTVFASIINDDSLSNDVKAELLTEPDFNSIAQSQAKIDVDNILNSKQCLVEKIVNDNLNEIKQALAQLSDIENGYQQEKVAQRRLKQVLLSYLATNKTEQTKEAIRVIYNQAQNMTEKMSALDAARINNLQLLDELLEQMDVEFSGQVLVLDKMLSTVAKVSDIDVYERMSKWTKHKDFSMKNPNRVRSLYGAFIMRNPRQFHCETGKGYEFLTNLLIEVDSYNPQVASRLVDQLLGYERYSGNRMIMMKNCLLKLKQQNLSKDLFEKVNSALS